MTMKDVVNQLKERGFYYTVHGIRKHFDMGLIPPHKHQAHKKRYITEEDFDIILFNVRMLSAGFSTNDLKEIHLKDNYDPVMCATQAYNRKEELSELVRDLLQIGEEKKCIKIARLIKSHRMIHNLTQEELAKQIEVTWVQVSRWENGHCMPSKMALKNLAELGVILNRKEEQ